MAILEIKNITKTFGGLKALDEINMSIEENTLTGFIGPNGCGKTTLYNVISGVYDCDSGSITFKGKELTKKFNKAKLKITPKERGKNVRKK